jgi:hypothetical protein
LLVLIVSVLPPHGIAHGICSVFYYDEMKIESEYGVEESVACMLSGVL